MYCEVGKSGFTTRLSNNQLLLEMRAAVRIVEREHASQIYSFLDG
jgi:hypothetical protein